jgi:hypothetical protein
MERGIMNLMNADPPEAARAEPDDEMVLDPRVQESIGRSLKASWCCWPSSKTQSGA